MTKDQKHSESWIANGKEWREVSYWVGNGWRTFLQVNVNGLWEGFA